MYIHKWKTISLTIALCASLLAGCGLNTVTIGKESGGTGNGIENESTVDEIGNAGEALNHAGSGNVTGDTTGNSGDTPVSNEGSGETGHSIEGNAGTDQGGSEPAGTPAKGDAVAEMPPPKPVAGNSGSAGNGMNSGTKPNKGNTAVAALSPLKETVKVNAQGLAVVTNATSRTVIVNKKRNLPSDYKPADLVIPKIPFSFSGESPKKQMRKEAARALEKLFAAADKAGIELKAVSGYRSYATQKSIFDRNAEQKGAAEANRTSAHPGQSEHQTGLAMDISSKSANYALETSFGKTKEGKWLAANAPKYGFIIRYLDGKEAITGYSYEPWHVRYIGTDLAGDIAASGLTLEEYANEAVPASGN
ncbi:M15 family metallopeptidase [Paenibacillus swuensis]|uniref:M15 family metallopeptidase n=1 Tax=Paenibacillus swuensis TaxID=1178515 RepID=UPI000A893A9F|nr:M15 family metallopeptidase [Paenibacillus swuensis]